MRIVAAVAAAALLLTGCGTSEEPGEDETASPTPSASPTAEETDLGAVCDALGETVTLPGGDAVAYLAVFNEPTGWATNAPVCDIEPDGEYYDVAAEAGEFGRAEFNYGVLTEEQLQEQSYPEYTAESAAELLTLEQAEPGNIEPDEPCAEGTCGDPMLSYMYSFRFETMMDDVAVIAQFDYITTDASGDEQANYRDQAIAALNAAMNAIAELG
jgi:hypothetical protein